ncbi:MAG TPA: hypothetical protein VKA43_16860, partial [Gammaproteobacteria bacterium]|nr:hypothetical protein [Gammaproteobacteria bacterium]
MVAFGVRPTSKPCAALLTLAALVAPCAAVAVDVPAFEDRQLQILEKIEQIQSRDGPYSPALLDELKGLILMYRENQEHALALVVIERALQVLRANSGLHTLDQVPLLWQRIESEEAIGNDAEVWDLEQELLMLARRHRDNLEAVPILRDLADRQMDVIGRFVNLHETPPQVIHGCYYKEWPAADAGNCHSGSRTTVVQGMLADANRNHADAIAILLRAEAYSSDELRALEMELVRGAELIREEYEHKGNRGVTGTRTKNRVPVPLVPWTRAAELVEPWRSRMEPVMALADWELPYDSAGTPEEDFLQELEPREGRFRVPYYRGRQSLRRLYVYEVAASSSRLDQAGAIVQMADWDLLFSNNGLATEGYALALRMLEEAQVDDASIAQLFAPEQPVVLPSFEPSPLARDETRSATGHVDVTFAITK